MRADAARMLSKIVSVRSTFESAGKDRKQDFGKKYDVAARGDWRLKRCASARRGDFLCNAHTIKVRALIAASL